MSATGRTRWFPRNIHPVRTGIYECRVLISRIGPKVLWDLKWNGEGLIVPFPMAVVHWRGLTKAAFKKTQGVA